MAYDGYVTWCNNEIVNSARLRALVDSGVRPGGLTVTCDPCGSLQSVVECRQPETPPEDYGDVTTAPWYDPDVPESGEFAGLLVTEITGLDQAPVQRAVTPVLGGGGVAGREQLLPRTVTITGWLVASSCCGLEYGYRWLVAAFRHPCAPECTGCDLDVLACCPELSDGQDPQQAAQRHWRTLYDVARVSGPNVVEKLGAPDGGCGDHGSCGLWKVEITLVAGQPHLYRQAELIVDRRPWACDDPPMCNVQWSKSPCTDPACSNGCGALADPRCMPAPLPAVPVPVNPCVCVPLQVCRTCVRVPGATVYDWFESVPVIEVYAGSRDLRNLVVRFYENPTDQPCDDLPKNECDACTEINVTYVPAYSTLRIDGTRQRVTVDSAGCGSRDASAVVYGRGGSPYRWPSVECGAYCICADVDANHVAPDATLTVYLVAREL